ncbi:MAG: 16S rRNA (guanine(527)-N(7))-methyltransferase RsmG [Desulfobacterales bacterium]
MTAAHRLKVCLTPGMVRQFSLYGEQLRRWNRKINLTTITDPKMVALKHFADSLAAVPLLPQAASILDVGSGGGFPGLCLKIARPDLKVTLLDAARKRIHFLKYLISRLGLSEVDAEQLRMEAAALRYPNHFQIIVSRAVTSLVALARAAQPCLGQGGMLIAWKGQAYQAEIAALEGDMKAGESAIRLRQCRTISYRLDELDLTRYLVLVRDPRGSQEETRQYEGWPEIAPLF